MSYDYNDYMYAVDRSDDYLAHYGVKGMKWGVRKAIASGNSRRLDRAYRKASRKLARLERRANSGAKYAKRAAALGAGAAAAGGLAAVGTRGVGAAMRTGSVALGRSANVVGKSADKLGRAMIRNNIRGAGIVRKAGEAATKYGHRAAAKGVTSGMALQRWSNGRHDIATAAQNISGKYGHPGAGAKVADQLNKRGVGSISNNTIARAGAAAVGAGLAGAAGYNAYRAATTKRAAKKAAQWKNEMNTAFKGTKYANGGNGGSRSGNRSRNRKRRRG